MICEHPHADCVDTKRRAGGYRYRRYRCRDCGERFSTVELRIDAEGPGRRAVDIYRRSLPLSDAQHAAITALLAAFSAWRA